MASTGFGREIPFRGRASRDEGGDRPGEGVVCPEVGVTSPCFIAGLQKAVCWGGNRQVAFAGLGLGGERDPAGLGLGAGVIVAPPFGAEQGRETSTGKPERGGTTGGLMHWATPLAASPWWVGPRDTSEAGSWSSSWESERQIVSMGEALDWQGAGAEGGGATTEGDWLQEAEKTIKEERTASHAI